MNEDDTRQNEPDAPGPGSRARSRARGSHGPGAAPADALAPEPRVRRGLRRPRQLLQHRPDLLSHRRHRACLPRGRGHPALPRRSAPDAGRRRLGRGGSRRRGTQSRSRDRGRGGAAARRVALSSRLWISRCGTFHPARHSGRRRRTRLVACLRGGTERRRQGHRPPRGARYRGSHPLRRRRGGRSVRGGSGTRLGRRRGGHRRRGRDPRRRLPEAGALAGAAGVGDRPVRRRRLGRGPRPGRRRR